ncbi:MAG: hypothetical protein GY729_10465 [Desulfobacteraceae bacterium]|nr:hypothetical protein [Desulfobacteraceae bacterium]
MDQVKDIVKKSAVFNSLENGDVDKVLQLFEKWPIQQGDVLAKAGDTAQHFFSIGSGHASAGHARG